MIRRTSLLIDNNDTGTRTLMFMIAEHMIDDMPDNDGVLWSKRCSGYDENKGYGIVLSVDWLNESEDILSPIGGKELELPPYSEEPQGNNTLYIAEQNDSSTLRNILPVRSCPAYVHCQIDNQRFIWQFLQTSQRLQTATRKLTEKYLGYDLVQYPYHIGNVYEVWYNNVIRAVDMTASPEPVGVYFRFSYWHVPSEVLHLTITDHHHRDVVLYQKHFEIEAGTKLFLAELPLMPKCLDVRLTDNNGQILYDQKNVTFVSDIVLDLQVQRLNLRLQDNRPVENKDPDVIIPKFVSDGARSITGRRRKAKQQSFENYFISAQMASREKTSSANYDFVFFDGDQNHREENVEKAKEVVLGIINRTRNVCYICDPYFHDPDFVEFIYKMHRLDVEVRIINCREQLLKAIEIKEGMTKEQIAEARQAVIRTLDDRIEDFKARLNIDNLECRIRLGKGDIHDRFIFADTQGWTLGSSFSELGNRCTCVQKIPEAVSKTILSRIDQWWNDTDLTCNLHDYVTNRNHK